METLFFDSVDNLLRVAISAPLLYIAIIIFVRLSGKRSTSQMNNFDWIVTVAMGSLCASGIVLKDVTILETYLGIAILLLLQYLLTKTVFYSDTLSNLVKPEPTLLVHEGEFLADAMRKERVTQIEILAAMRGSGVYHVANVQWVILETDSSLSVVPKVDDISNERATALQNVHGFPPVPH